MPRYDLLGLTLDLPWRLERAESHAPADFRITLGQPETVPAGPDGAPLNMRRDGTTLELSMPGSCRIRVSAEGREVVVAQDPREDPREVRRQVLEHLIPRLLSRRHALVLHASSVVMDGRALGFLATSGAGKSTLALALGRRGATVLGDDSLVIDATTQGPLALALWSNVRVHMRDLPVAVRAQLPPAVRDKAMLQEGTEPALRFTRDAHPLRAVYVLEEAPEVEIERLPPRAALLSLLRETYQLEFDDRLGLERLMARVESLGLTSCTFRLAYPRDFDRLDELCARVADHAVGL